MSICRRTKGGAQRYHPAQRFDARRIVSTKNRCASATARVTSLAGCWMQGTTTLTGGASARPIGHSDAFRILQLVRPAGDGIPNRLGSERGLVLLSRPPASDEPQPIRRRVSGKPRLKPGGKWLKHGKPAGSPLFGTAVAPAAACRGAWAWAWAWKPWSKTDRRHRRIRVALCKFCDLCRFDAGAG